MQGQKLSVRQRMINMMYLVLLAILAINVSVEVLKAFYKTEVSLKEMGKTIDTKNATILGNFTQLMKTQPENTRRWNDLAIQGKSLQDDFIAYVEGIKKEIEKESGGRITDEKGNATELRRGDNTDVSSNLMINMGKAKELRARLDATKKQMLALLPEEDRKYISPALYALDEKESTWEVGTFDNVPAAAVITTLTKIQNDCRILYSDILNTLYQKTTGELKPVDRLQAMVMPRKSNVLAGEPFEADIFLAAYDSKQTSQFIVDGKEFTPSEGMVNYKVPTHAQGNFTLSGMIRVKEKDGMKDYPFSTSYNVYNGFASVAADKLNVFFLGLDNPVTISVPGYPTDKVKVSISNGQIMRIRDNKYNVKPTVPGPAKITVSAQDDKGNWKSFGVFDYVVKRIPAPPATLGSLPQGLYSKGKLATQGRLVCNLGPEFIMGSISFRVLEYKCYVINRGILSSPYKVKGADYGNDVKNAIMSTRSGDMVVFTDIIVTGPSGDAKLGDITYRVQ